MYKGTGNGGSITINNLILNGGVVSHQNGLGDIFNLYGHINAVADSSFWSKQGEIYVFADMHGSGNLNITATDANTSDARYVHLLADNSSYTGKFTVGGHLDFATAASLGASPATLTPDWLTLDGGWLSTTNTVMLGANAGITVGSGGTIKVSGPNGSLSIAGPITGGGALTKTGNGALTLAGNNDFSGGLTFNAGGGGSQLNINSANALGSGILIIGTSSQGPAVLDNTSGSAVTVANVPDQVWYNNITFLGSSSLDMSAAAAYAYADVTVTVSNNNLTVGQVAEDGSYRALTKRGPGTLTINGGASIYGDMTVDEGTLVLLGSGALVSSSINVASNATLDVSSTSGLTLSAGVTYYGTGQSLTGGGTVVGNVADDGAGLTTIEPGSSIGTLTINGNLSLNGGTALNFELSPTTTVGSGVNDLLAVTGQLSINGATTLNITGVPVAGTYTLIQYGSFPGSLANLVAPPGYDLTNNTTAHAIEVIVSHVPANLTWQGDSVNNMWDVGATANWLESGTNKVFFNGDEVTFTDSGSSSPAVTLASDVSPISVTVNTSQNYIFTGGGIAYGSLTKSGSGTLILDNTNSYSGPTVINAGTLQLGDPNVGTFGVAGSLGTGNVTNAATLVFNRAYYDLNIGGNVNNSGSISNIGPGGTVTLSGNIRGSGNIAMAGSGDMVLSGSNSYSGPTTISSGTLHVRNDDALGSAAAGSEVAPGGRIYIDRNINILDEPFTLNGEAIQKGGAGVTILGGPITLGSDVTFNVDGGANLVLSNATGLSGAVAVTKSGSGDLSLDFPSAYTGGTTLSGGTINFNANGALGSGAVSATAGRIVIAAGQSFTNSVSASGVDPGVGLGFFTGLSDTNGNATVSGPISFDVSPASGGSFAGPGNPYYLNVLSSINSPAGTYVSVRTGNVRFSGGGNYPQVLVGANTTSIGANNGIAPNAVMDMAAYAANAFTLVYFDMNGFNQTLAGLDNLTAPGNVGYVNNTNPTLSTLTLNVDPSTNYVFAGGIIGNVSLVLGSGTEVFAMNASPLTAVFSYTGDTLINGGTLVLSNGVQLTGTPTISVAGAGTLDASDGGLVLGVDQTLKGNGTVVGSVMANGTVSPGASVGTLTINGDLTLLGTVRVEVDKSLSQSNDLTMVSGVLTNAGGAVVSVENLGPGLAVGDTFTVFSQRVLNGAAMSVVGGGAVWNNNLETDGSISVASLVASQPQFNLPTVSAGDLVLSGTGGPANGSYIVLGTTNVVLPLANWDQVATGSFDGSGNFGFTNAINAAAPRQFYLLQVQ